MNPIQPSSVTKAIKVAQYTNVRRARVAALAFSSSGTIIAHAHNRRIEGKSKQWTQHAEEVLIGKLKKIKAFQRFGDISILVLRVSSDGLSMAKPCLKCQKLLRRYGLATIYYTDRQGEMCKML